MEYRGTSRCALQGGLSTLAGERWGLKGRSSTLAGERWELKGRSSTLAGSVFIWRKAAFPAPDINAGG